MARPVDPEIRPKILKDCANAAMRSGLHDLSLLQLSRHIDVSPRMLIYHFGSAENLVEQTLLEVQKRVREQLHGLFAKDPKKDTRRAILKVWRHGTSSAMEAFFRSYFYLSSESLVTPRRRADFIENSVRGWVAWMKENLADHRPQVSEPDLTLIMGVLRGLFLDYWATRDRQRTSRALKDFLRKYRFGAAGPRPQRADEQR